MFKPTEDENFIKQKAAFEAYYESVLLPKLQENDKIRRRYFLMFVILLLLALIFYPLVIWAILTLPDDNTVDIGAILCASGFVILTLRGPIKATTSLGRISKFTSFKTSRISLPCLKVLLIFFRVKVVLFIAQSLRRV